MVAVSIVIGAVSLCGLCAAVGFVVGEATGYRVGRTDEREAREALEAQERVARFHG